MCTPFICAGLIATAEAPRPRSSRSCVIRPPNEWPMMTGGAPRPPVRRRAAATGASAETPPSALCRRQMRAFYAGLVGHARPPRRHPATSRRVLRGRPGSGQRARRSSSAGWASQPAGVRLPDSRSRVSPGQDLSGPDLRDMPVPARRSRSCTVPGHRPPGNDRALRTDRMTKSRAHRSAALCMCGRFRGNVSDVTIETTAIRSEHSVCGMSVPSATTPHWIIMQTRHCRCFHDRGQFRSLFARNCPRSWSTGRPTGISGLFMLTDA